MPYSGGSSTNAGVSYQNWFLALQFAFAYFEKDYEIFPEVLRSDLIFIDDILVRQKDEERYYNIKLSSPNTSLHWNLSALNDLNIIRDFKKQFEQSPNSKLILVSECNCYLFAEVFKRARNSSGPQDIHHYLDSDICISIWEKAKELCNYDDFKMIQFAHQIYIRTLPEDEIKFFIKHRFLNVTNQSLIANLLLSKAIETSKFKTTVTKEVINGWFLQENIKIKV